MTNGSCTSILFVTRASTRINRNKVKKYIAKLSELFIMNVSSSERKFSCAFAQPFSFFFFLRGWGRGVRNHHNFSSSHFASGFNHAQVVRSFVMWLIIILCFVLMHTAHCTIVDNIPLNNSTTLQCLQCYPLPNLCPH